MQSLERIQSSGSSYTHDSRRDSYSTRTRDSFDSWSSRPTTIESSPQHSYVRMSPKPVIKVVTEQPQSRVGRRPSCYHDDLSPGTTTCARSSVETYASNNSSLDDILDDEEECGFYSSIPPLPIYCPEIVEEDVRPASPHEFSKLFPSMDRLSIRHDNFTSDGNMNLRVDTTVLSSGRHRRPRTVQLFHLRMHDLARRDFSLRRYCRDSGREVCSSKRKYSPPSSPAKSHKSPVSFPPSLCSSPVTPSDKSKPTFTRSVTSAITRSFSSARPDSRSKRTLDQSSIGGSLNSVFDSYDDNGSSEFGVNSPTAAAAAATNTIKLDFSNYARVEVERKGKSGSDSKRYEFEWWGNSYSWRRATDKDTGIVSFHLMRHGQGGSKTSNKGQFEGAIAHIVPEARSPVQIAADEEAGGWIPPCHFWINDWSVIDAKTDVADIIIATGLMALVDDCIKQRWQTPKIHRIPLPLTSRTWDLEYVGPKAFLQRAFSFRTQNSTPKPVDETTTRAVAVYEDDYDYDEDDNELRPYRANYHRHPVVVS
ncbi:hypothetical protein MCOR12_006360 [Pyricularia oryzae]|nr:hypothetical protein MCOR12_006360 [Pyricularia oryzae]